MPLYVTIECEKLNVLRFFKRTPPIPRDEFEVHDSI